jgi:tRNA dimethylallyltransferase
MSAKKHLLVIGGPTAGGKTGFAIRLARHFRTDIVSADSRQFFREMTIGVAKPTAKELAAAPHHFIGHLSVEQPYSVGAYERDTLTKLEELFREKDVVILAGGSGLYINALCQGMDEFPEVPLRVRKEVELLYQQEGLAALHRALAEADPDYLAEADRQNPHRLIRALAVCRAAGKPFSSFRKRAAQARSFTPVYLQMHWPRAALYDRINRRVDQMMADGLLEEARRLLPYRRHTALQTVGYRELFDYLDGRTDLETAVELIKRNTRRYAKRQLTWMRRDGFWKHFHPSEWELTLPYLQAAAEEDWQWREHTFPLPLGLDARFSLREKDREKARVLTLYREDRLLAAALIYSFKRFEWIGRLYVEPGLSEETIRYFLHEAICRCEDAVVCVQLPAIFFPWLAEWGFEETKAIDWPELAKAGLLRTEDGVFLGRRGSVGS